MGSDYMTISGVGFDSSPDPCVALPFLEEAMRLAERVRPKEAKFVPRRKKPLEKTVTGKIREEVAKLQERDTDAARAPRSAAAGAYLDARGGPGS